MGKDLKVMRRIKTLKQDYDEIEKKNQLNKFGVFDEGDNIYVIQIQIKEN